MKSPSKIYSSIMSLLVLLLLSTARIAMAASTACPAQYLNGVAPDIVNQKLTVKARELCYDCFVVMHSGASRTPLWTAEHLTRASVQQADNLNRPDPGPFHAEQRLPANERAELTDYARSGYDRGHMSPNGDMPTPNAQFQSFTLANMIPQNPNNNRQLWERIEAATRRLAVQNGEVYVISGPVFKGTNVKALKGRVLIPTNIFKIVYDPKQKKGAAYYVDNTAGKKYQVLSISEIEKIAGINFFPGLSESAKKDKLNLPVPNKR